MKTIVSNIMNDCMGKIKNTSKYSFLHSCCSKEILTMKQMKMKSMTVKTHLQEWTLFPRMNFIVFFSLYFLDYVLKYFREPSWNWSHLVQVNRWWIANIPEEVVRRCSVKKVFLKISQTSQQNTCVRVSFLIKLKTWGLKLY